MTFVLTTDRAFVFKKDTTFVFKRDTAYVLKTDIAFDLSTNIAFVRKPNRTFVLLLMERFYVLKGDRTIKMVSLMSDKTFAEKFAWTGFRWARPSSTTLSSWSRGETRSST
jgi:hypothetical protein